LDHDYECEPDGKQVILEALSLLGAKPVHEETAGSVRGPDDVFEALDLDGSDVTVLPVKGQNFPPLTEQENPIGPFYGVFGAGAFEEV
jgi:hypothetical protein